MKSEYFLLADINITRIKLLDANVKQLRNFAFCRQFSYFFFMRTFFVVGGVLWGNRVFRRKKSIIFYGIEMRNLSVMLFVFFDLPWTFNEVDANFNEIIFAFIVILIEDYLRFAHVCHF